MNKIIFKRKCRFKGKIYDVGDELKKCSKEDIIDIRKLNERGFIDPLNQKELKQIADGSFFIKSKSKRKG